MGRSVGGIKIFLKIPSARRVRQINAESLALTTHPPTHTAPILVFFSPSFFWVVCFFLLSCGWCCFPPCSSFWGSSFFRKMLFLVKATRSVAKPRSRETRFKRSGPDGSDRPTQPKNKTHPVNHAGDTHQMKMGVFFLDAFR